MRIVLCRGQYCNLGRRSDTLYKRLDEMVRDLNGDAYPPRIKLETANCLSMCGAGPNLIIYPDGLVCNHTDDKVLAQVVEPHLRGTDEPNHDKGG